MARGRIIIIVGVTVILMILAWVYYVTDPSGVSWMPRCPLHALTGLDCPGCGSQRMIHSLLHGDIAGAWHANAFLFCALPVLLFLIIVEIRQHLNPSRNTSLYRRIYGPAAAPVATVLLIGWFVVRNFLI